jgi:putative ABC transport system permease protein
MPLVTTLRVALTSLQANRMRSLLAMLGIVIGIAAVIAMLAIGAGAQKSILSRISSMGTNLLSVDPGQRRQGGVRMGQVQTLTVDDARAILAEVKSVDSLSPVTRNSAQAKYLNLNTNVNIQGVAVPWPSIRNYEIVVGRMFNDQEVNSKARVVVLGAQTATDLGLTELAIGENVKMKGIAFKLIGIFKAKGNGGFFSQDSIAVIPYTTAMDVVFGLNFLNSIDAELNPSANLDEVKAEITTIMRKRHRISDPTLDDFSVDSQADIIAMASESSKTFTVLLGTIASISLLVGGIGIMNIMLVTVTERTREIGIRKAIGAKEKDILLQFLFEAVIMCVVGGLIGVALGIVAAQVIAKASAFQTSIQLSVILIALFFSVSVGIFFGYYPAKRAAVLDPVDALSYE